ncbi:MAG TPA: tetratricopeptide repeat protein [Pirellulales bacterium]
MTLLLIAASPAAAFAADPNDETTTGLREGIRLIQNDAAYLDRVGRAESWFEEGNADRAITDCNEAIRLNPNDPLAYLVRSSVWTEKGESEKAIADCNEAIRLDPKDPDAYIARSGVCTAKGETDKAIADCSEAIRLDPKSDVAYLIRGLLRSSKQQYDRAIADYSEVIRLNPSNPEGYDGVAWLRAACPDSRYRGASAAIKFATKACERTLWKSSIELDVLAAAYAESGEFDKAIQWGEKALNAAVESEKEAIGGRLALYRRSKPYRKKFGIEEILK